MPIVTTAGWKAWRGYTGTDFDTVVAAVIPQVQARMERFLSCKLDKATYTDQVHDGTGTAVIYTRNWPVQTLTTVKIDGTAVDSTGYQMETGEASMGRLIRKSYGSGLNYWPEHDNIRAGPCWPVGRENITITYVAGYSDSEGDIAIPDDLKEAAYVLIDHALAQRGNSIGLSASARGSDNLTFRTAAELMAEYHRLIGPFRRAVL